jgi:hypothetical protein
VKSGAVESGMKRACVEHEARTGSTGVQINMAKLKNPARAQERGVHALWCVGQVTGPSPRSRCGFRTGNGGLPEALFVFGVLYTRLARKCLKANVTGKKYYRRT